MNTTIRTLSTLALLAAAAAAGCKKESAIDKVKSQVDEAPPAASTGDPVQITVTVPKPEVALGDDIVFHFKLTNSGKSKVQVNVPRLDRRSASIRVRRPDGTIATVTRILGEPTVRGEWVYEAAPARDLAPGESLEQDVSIVAIQAGKLAFTPTYVRQGAVSPQAAATIDVTVTPPDPKTTRLGVKLETTHGSYTAVFRPDVAYNTAESFASLVKRGFYDGLKFHRILSDFMAQGGDPKGDGSGGPGYSLPLEANLALRHTRGVMSMGRSAIPRIGQDTAGSQFFLMFETRPSLDRDFPREQGGDGYGYTTFAQMVDGEETLKRLQAVPCGPNMQGEPSVPKELVQIKSAQLVFVP